MGQQLRNILSSLGEINENPTLRRIKANLFTPLTALLIKIGLRPTTLNFIGLFLGLLAAVIIGSGQLMMGALVLLLAGLADISDGMVARALNLDSKFGVFFDSVLDRYVDTAVFLGLAWYFMSQGTPLYVLLTFVTVIGTVVTSYSRARAESLGLSSRYIGFLNRPERVILLLIGLLFPATLLVISWILAVLSNITAVHRVMFYSRDALALNREQP